MQVLVLGLYICKFSQMFIMVPLCGMCFINVMLVMSGNSCPVFIACVAKLYLYIVASRDGTNQETQ